MKKLLVSDIGLTKYAYAWELQQKLFALRQSEQIKDILILTEHEHVYTLGKSSDEAHLLATNVELIERGIDTFKVDRGGDITYHGPGQIVAYPILNLLNYKQDIHWYLRKLEEVIIIALGEYGVTAYREEGLTGVWVMGEKIAAIGIKISRWITMHGFALNVNTDLTKFERIIPCGIFHKGVTSLKSLKGKEIQLAVVKETIIKSFSEVFKVEISVINKNDFLRMILEHTEH